MREWLLVVAACGSGATSGSGSGSGSAAGSDVDTSTWMTIALPAPFKTPGTIKAPKGSKLLALGSMAAARLELPDGTMADLLELAPGTGSVENGKMLRDGFAMNKIEVLVEHHNATSWVIGIKRFDGPRAVMASDWTVAPGIGCGKSLQMTADLSIPQVHELAAVCVSLSPK